MLQDFLDHNRVAQLILILLPMSTFNATVLELACQNEEHDVTTRTYRLSCRHHLQSKHFQVLPIAVVFNKKYSYASSR